MCVCLRVCAYVRIYVGAYCLSSRYLTQCVSSHVPFLHKFAEHIAYYWMPAASVACRMVAVCVIFVLLFGKALSVLYLILISWLDDS